VATAIDGRRTLCLKVERVGKDHVNHFLIPVDPMGDRRNLGLLYIDPNDEVTAVEGVAFAFSDAEEGVLPNVGDAFSAEAGIFIKVRDLPSAKRFHTYVDIATGLLRHRVERNIGKVLEWRVDRI
jgi:hypothetical protein